jgi:hypothetical protein
VVAGVRGVLRKARGQTDCGVIHRRENFCKEERAMAETRRKLHLLEAEILKPS